jgi:hypothetical protein
MSAFTRYTDAAARCAFCVKPLPIINGELRPWRAPSGEFFCNEFCADDAEEARQTICPRAPRPDVRSPVFCAFDIFVWT